MESIKFCKVKQSCEARQARLTKYLHEFDLKIPQRSDEWLAIRKYAFGGSNIATVKGLNPYENLRSLMEGKLGMAPHSKGIAMYWGTMFEDIVKEFCEVKFNTQIIGDDGFIKGPRDSFNYSPDGLGFINHNGKNICALFEFKCPFNRSPIQNQAPSYYIPQVKAGLDVIPICEIGVFIESVIRRCEWEDLDFGTVCDSSTLKQKVPPPSSKVHCLGLLGMFITDKLIEDEDKLDLLDKIHDQFSFEYPVKCDEEHLNDLGKSSKELFSLIMEGVDAKIIEIERDGNIYTPSIKKINKTFQRIAGEKSKRKLLGILPWKMLYVNTVMIDKEEGYLDNETLDTMDELRQLIIECEKPENKGFETNLLDQYFCGTDDLFA